MSGIAYQITGKSTTSKIYQRSTLLDLCVKSTGDIYCVYGIVDLFITLLVTTKYLSSINLHSSGMHHRRPVPLKDIGEWTHSTKPQQNTTKSKTCAYFLRFCIFQARLVGDWYTPQTGLQSAKRLWLFGFIHITA